MTAEDRPGARSAYLLLSLLQARAGVSVVSRLGSLPPESVLRMPVPELAARVKMTGRAAGHLEELRRSFDPEDIDRQLEEKGLASVTPIDAGYPEKLREMPDPPPALFVGGELPGGPAVAVVGSRKATVTGLETARHLGRALGRKGVCVVSGLALGVDAAAHEGSLAGGGPTVGVLGCGIDVVYPKRNRGLFGRVRRSGAIVSEYYLEEAPLAWRFPARNRIIAGLADVLVVVEAPEKSGALITARHALDAGRDVWAVPGPAGVPECRGSNRLLADGAGVLWDVDEFVEAVVPEDAPGVVPGSARDERLFADEAPAELPAGEARVLTGVGFGPTGVDEVAARSGVEMRELLAALAMLELKGYVGRDAGGSYVRRGGRPLE